jgi:predicted PurR-regulated permease PerM
MPRVETPSPVNRLITLASFTIVMALLYVGREVLVPIALAVLLSFMLAPVVRRFERWGLHRAPAVLFVVSMAFSMIVGIGWVATDQLVDLAGKMPEYKVHIQSKLEWLRGSRGKNITDATRTIRELGQELVKPVPEPIGDQPQTQPIPFSAPQTRIQPLPVEIVNPPSHDLQFLRDTIGAVMGPLGHILIVVVFVIFILMMREDLRDRVIRLLGPSQINITTQALNEAGDRISRYLLIQFVMNIAYGIPIGIGLALIGVPNAILWGVLTAVLKYLPYIGPWIAASMPVLLSLASPDWYQPVYTIALFVGVEAVAANFLEPWIYAHNTGITSIAVLGAAVFWTWLWGIIGLMLSTPLTVLLVVLGKYVPQFSFFNIMLGDQPVLEPKARFYQRLLAADEDEAEELFEEFLEEKPLSEVYDTMLVPALSLMEKDRRQGRLSSDKQAYLHETIAEMIDELGERKKVVETRLAGDGAVEAIASSEGERQRAAMVPVLCVPARNSSDHLASDMLRQVLEANGLHVAGNITPEMLASELIEKIEETDARIVVISALPPGAIARARYLCKRIRVRCRDVVIVVGLWDSKVRAAGLKSRLGCGADDKVVTSFSEALEVLAPLVNAQQLKVAAEGIEEPIAPPRVARSASAESTRVRAQDRNTNGKPPLPTGAAQG